MDHGILPDGLTLVRVTDVFDADTVPAGLRRAHRVAVGVWGVLRVEAGAVRFVWEDEVGMPLDLVAGDSAVIEPDRLHHVEPGPDARFSVAFHR
jgi:tellurite resistance-related uncharacterized protein